MKKRILRFLAIICALPCICSGLIYGVNTVNDLQYPDFTQFPTASDLEAYLENHLTFGKTTRVELESFLQGAGLNNCTYSEEFDVTSCQVRAPKDYSHLSFIEALLNRTVARWYYHIVFIFKSDTIEEIIVHHLGKIWGIW